ncbi:hypothetical protein [Caproicibacter sp.]|uniref:hypothetical protein n=1 Tax=Caproicibacter sp. TaxID=2814884 RepID=UPI003988E461
MKKENQDKNETWLSCVIGVGIPLGAAFGLIFNNLSMGTSFGILFGAVIYAVKRKEK